MAIKEPTYFLDSPILCEWLLIYNANPYKSYTQNNHKMCINKYKNSISYLASLREAVYSNHKMSGIFDESLIKKNSANFLKADHESQ